MLLFGVVTFLFQIAVIEAGQLQIKNIFIRTKAIS